MEPHHWLQRPRWSLSIGWLLLSWPSLIGGNQVVSLTRLARPSPAIPLVHPAGVADLSTEKREPSGGSPLAGGGRHGEPGAGDGGTFWKFPWLPGPAGRSPQRRGLALAARAPATPPAPRRPQRLWRRPRDRAREGGVRQGSCGGPGAWAWPRLGGRLLLQPGRARPGRAFRARGQTPVSPGP